VKKKELAELRAMMEEAMKPVCTQVDALSQKLDMLVVLVANSEFKQRVNGHVDEVADGH
jgi:hypothetical protein